LESNKDVTDIKLTQRPDYENNMQYSLKVRVRNKYELTAEAVVEVLKVNDNIPIFCYYFKRGSVLENDFLTRFLA